MPGAGKKRLAPVALAERLLREAAARLESVEEHINDLRPISPEQRERLLHFARRIEMHAARLEHAFARH